MFSLADTPVKFIGLLILFAWCTLWCGYELTRPQNGRQRVSNVLHLAMAVVMLLMVAAPTWTLLTAVVPDVWLTAGFAASTVWFVVVAGRGFATGDRSGGRHGLGHAAMFGAMTWHLAAMAAMSVAMTTGMSGHGGMADHGGMSDHGGMGGAMDMGAWMAEQSRPGGLLWSFALIGVPFMVYLLASSLYSAWLATRPSVTPGAAETRSASSEPRVSTDPRVSASAVTLATRSVVAANPACHEVRPQGSLTYRLAHSADFAMNAGMFWMSTGLLVPLLPFSAALSF